MIVGEHQGQVAGVAADVLLVPATHKHTLIGHEHIVKNGQGLHIADVRPGGVDVLALVMLAGQSHQLDAVPVGGQGEGHSVVGVVGAHKLGGQGDDLIHIGGAGVADLGAADDDALGGLAVDADAVHVSLHHVEKLIGVGLHMGALILGVTGALHVRLGAVADQVVVLAVLQVLVQALVILGTAGLVAVVGDGEQSVEGVRAHAALHTAAHTVADQAGHQLLLQQVLLGVVDMGGTVDGVAGQVARDGAHVGVTGVVGGVIALLHDISAAHDPIGQVALRALLTVGTVQLLAMQVNVGLHLQQALFVLLIGANTVFRHFDFLHILLALPHIKKFFDHGPKFQPLWPAAEIHVQRLGCTNATQAVSAPNIQAVSGVCPICCVFTTGFPTCNRLLQA